MSDIERTFSQMERMSGGKNEFGKWQSIRTAPKDGTRIIIGSELGVEIGAYGHRTDGLEAGFLGESGTGDAFHGPNWMFHEKDAQPTHWMPLPDMPTLK